MTVPVVDPWALAADIVDPPANPYVDDPVAWVQDRTRAHAWSAQRRILESVRDHRQTAVPSSHGPGKSWCAARIAAWWIDSHPPLEAFVVTTAPTDTQVKAILWREIQRAHRRGNLAGRVTQDAQWKISDELVAFGRKPADIAADSDGETITAFQGIHARFVLVIFDEACHDDETDVLTEAGWRRFADLDGTERLLTMDPETQLAEYRLPVRIVRKPYSGPMVEYAATGGNFCVTPDHEMFVRSKRWRLDPPWSPWHKRRIGDIAHENGHYMVKTVRWGTPDVDQFIIPECVGARKTVPARAVAMDDWMTFLGWYCSEGHIIKRGDKVFGVGISQDDPVVLKEIHDLCLRLALPAKMYDRQIHVHSMQIGRHLAQFGAGATSKRVPDYARMAGVRQIGLFLDSFARGDGYRKGAGEILYTSSQRLADDLQEMVLKTGHPSTLRTRALAGQAANFGTHVGVSTTDGFVVSRPDRQSFMRMKPEKVRTIHYDGTVYCATVPPHHLLFTRRRGYTMWSGNSGIPKPLWNAAHSLLTNADARFLAIGNPDDPTSEFAHICAGADPRAGGTSVRGWHVIPISLFDTPNFTGEDVPAELRPYLPSQAWLDSFVLNVGGPGTAIYTSKVDGLFPSDAKDGVVPWSWVIRARSIDATERIGPLRVPVELGVDVGASDNGDLTVVRERQGMRAGRRWTAQSSDPEVVAAKVVQAARESGATRIKVDAIGVGWSLVALLRRDLPGVIVDPVVVSEAAPPGPDGEVYVNLRAALWWEIGRGLSRAGAWDLSELEDRAVADLTEPRWWEDKSGRIQVEPKEGVRKRLGRSPDDADALLLAFYVPPTTNVAGPIEVVDQRLGGRRAR